MIKNKYFSTFATVFVAFLAAQTASATVVFTNFGSGLSFDFTQANLIGNDFAGDNAGYAQEFTAGADYTFSNLTIAVSCFGSGSCTDPVVITLNQDSSGAPGAVLETFAIAGALLPVSGSSYAPLSFISVTSPTLTNGGNYWISVVTAITSTAVWNYNSISDTSPNAFSTDGGSTWSAFGATPGAFQVSGDLSSASPEPGTMLGLATGLLALFSARKFGRK